MHSYKMSRAAADSRSKSNRIAALNAATPRAGSHLPEAQRPSEPETANQSLSLGVPKGPFSFAKENGPFAPAARRRHTPSHLCEEREHSLT